MQEKIQGLVERKNLYHAYQRELEETGETQKLITDPEARMMHSHKDGYHCCYNIHTAVSSCSHLVVDYQVTNHRNHQGILHDFCQQLKRTTQQPILSVLGDKGYECKEEMLDCILDGILPYVGFRDDKEHRLYSLPYEPASITHTLRHSTDPQDIRTCLHAGVLPTCYENTHLSIETKDIGQVGAFLRGEDQTFVTCPMGHRLPKTKDKGPGSVYGKRAACRACDNRCTPSKNHKTVYFGPKSHCVATRMYGDQPAVNLPPPGFTPTNSFYKKDPVERTVLLSVADDIPKQKERLCISEHPFGTVKWYHGANYLLCKGISKTTAEIGLSFLAYNLRRAINMVGAKALIQAMRGA